MWLLGGYYRACAWLEAAAFAQPLSCNSAGHTCLNRAEVTLELEPEWVREELLRSTT